MESDQSLSVVWMYLISNYKKVDRGNGGGGPGGHE
jgi:hypothetical protein